MKNPIPRGLRIKTLRTHITLTVSMILALTLLCSGLFLYTQTAGILTDNYKQLLVQQLDQVNSLVYEQISIIDSVNPLFLSNNLIRDTLEPASSKGKLPYIEKKLALEKQMSYLLISNYLWNEKFIDAVYIFDSSGHSYSMAPSGNQINALVENQKILESIDRRNPSLMIKTLEENEKSLYFIRNIFSMYTGDYIATIIININQHTWANYYSANLNENWFVYLYHEEMNLLTDENMADAAAALPALLDSQNREKPQELTLGGEDYFIAFTKIPNADITSVVAAPKNKIFQDLNAALKTYLLILCMTALSALFISILLSRTITRPIDKMIYYVKRISKGHKEKMPPLEMYSEFSEFADAFNQMLEQLDFSYNDNFQKQLLLKNAEIKALQSQMDPHFLFNVLNTIAWKAQMSSNEDIYQMIISLGELLKMNTMSHENGFISLEEEIKYIRFYIYLQKMRFEDKISMEMQIDPKLYAFKIPIFCIQPLVENAIVHGLEPKKGAGRLIVNIIENKEYMEVSVIDNGMGFQSIPNIQDIASSSGDSHTHIGLKNLDKRLFLLFGEISRLHITSIPNECTTISFQLPYQLDAGGEPGKGKQTYGISFIDRG